MHNRMTSRRRTPDDMGRTTPAQGDTSVMEEVPRLPHERDESSDSQPDAAAGQRAVGKQAHRDVQRGLVDTDRGPVLDKAYNEKVAPNDTRSVKR